MTHALIFVDDSMPGIRRRPSGKRGWAYFDAEGQRITERAEIDRLNRIGLPPAYVDAWFAPNAHAHILATGIDARGRKQYRYHPDFTAERDARKYEGCAAFGALLPLLRRRVEDDLAGRGLTAERAIASVVQLLDSGRIRIGNEAYAKSNRSFGATTLRRRHAKVVGSRLTLRFKAKSGKLSEVSMTDRRLIRFVRHMQDLPGQHLFQYLRDDGTASPVSSSDVNGYLRETMGADFTAKHFRTWRASVLAFDWLLHEQEVSTLTAMLTHVSEHLGNTPAIARKSYIHPTLVSLARDGASDFRKQTRLPRQTKWLSRPERGLIAWLEEQQIEAG